MGSVFLVGESLAACDGLTELGMAGIGELVSASANSLRAAATKAEARKNESTKLKPHKDYRN
jgi:hypothetical protein